MKLFIHNVIGLFMVFFLLSFTPQKNSITIKLTDSPANYSALYVEIVEVSIFGEEQGWITLSDQTQYINVLSLTNGTEIELAQIIAKEDVYTKLMVRFGNENNIYLYGDKTSDNKVATIAKSLGWKGEHEIYIPIFQNIPGDNWSEVLLDFNVARSITKEGNNYSLQPFLQTIENKNTGISGHVTGAPMVMVEIYNNENAYSAFADPNGNFLIRGMAPGNYTMSITTNVISYNENMEPTKSYYQVKIVEGSINELDPVMF